MNKRAMTQLKAYFLILNIVVGIIAFSWIVRFPLQQAEAYDDWGHVTL